MRNKRTKGGEGHRPSPPFCCSRTVIARAHRARGNPSSFVSDGLFSFSSEKGAFRAPARGTFALGGKSTQKRRSNLRFENPLRAFTCFLSCQNKPRERCAVEISPKYCIVSASLFAAAFALKCRAVWFFVSWQDRLSNGGPWPPPTFAAKRQRRDLIIAQTHGVRFPKGRGRTGRKLSERKIG